MDQFDRAQQSEQADRDAALVYQQRKQVREIPDEDESGRYCLNCGVQIPPKRLQFMPDAVRCVRCQTVKESSWN